jgi:hypothetical protein
MESNFSSQEDLNTRLRAVELQFEQEMRARGFDPAQADNVALPGDLARLYSEREELREKLEDMEAGLDE